MEDGTIHSQDLNHEAFDVKVYVADCMQCSFSAWLEPVFGLTNGVRNNCLFSVNRSHRPLRAVIVHMFLRTSPVTLIPIISLI